MCHGLRFVLCVADSFFAPIGDVALSSASFILMSSNLRSLLTLIDLSATVFRRVKFNFVRDTSASRRKLWTEILTAVLGVLPIALGDHIQLNSTANCSRRGLPRGTCSSVSRLGIVSNGPVVSPLVFMKGAGDAQHAFLGPFRWSAARCCLSSTRNQAWRPVLHRPNGVKQI